MCYVMKLHLEAVNRKLDSEEAEGVKERGFRYLT